MPLSFADINAVNTIRKVGGSKEQHHHLENLGFVEGAQVIVVSIVNIKDVRIALSEELARKILV